MTELRDIPYLLALSVYLNWTILFLVGHIRDFIASFMFWLPTDLKPGYAPIRQDYEDFYTRRAYYRLVDCFSRPVLGPPDRVMEVALRSPPENNQPLLETGEVNRCINIGSYNYLGFASQDAFCTPRCLDTLAQFSLSACSAREDGGTTTVHTQLERAVAAFLKQEDAIVLGMGYATNAAIIPALCGRGDLVISDALNHASIVNGIRGTGGTVKIFRHNDPSHLERVLRQAIADGQPRTHRPWRKILIVVEGIYSMEGEAHSAYSNVSAERACYESAGFTHVRTLVCALKEIVALKNKYKAYLFLDEAHSIGAMGATGRGVCEYTGVDFGDVDVLMGTFTKSFGSCGGYVAGSRKLITHLRNHSPAHILATSISPVAAQQIISSLSLLSEPRGLKKIRQLKENANYFRARLLEMGFHCLGDWDSPVIPVMIYRPTALAHFSRECLRQHVAIVVVGFPATSLLTARARICISACHERADLDYCLSVLQHAGMLTGSLIKRRVPKGIAAPGREADTLLRRAHDSNTNLIA